MVVGEHLQSSDAAKYGSVALNFLNLEEVAGFWPMPHSPLRWRRGKLQSLSVTFKPPKTLRARVSGYTVETAYAAQTSGDDFRRQGIDVRAWLRLTPETEVHLDEFLSGPCKMVSQLIGLALGRSPTLTRVQAESPRTQIMIGGKARPNPTTIIFAQGSPSAPAGKIHPVELPFTLAGLRKRFRHTLLQWQRRMPLLEPSLDFFFSLDADRSVSQEHHFLNATNAIESFHRGVSPNQKRWPDKEFDARVTSILSSVPNSDRTWLEEQLRYANEVRFRARVKETFDEQPAEVQTVIGEKRIFVEKVVNTRNYLTHHDEKLRAKAVRDIAELWRITRGLRLMLQCLFLRELDFSGPDLTEAVKRTSDYRILVENPGK